MRSRPTARGAFTEARGAGSRAPQLNRSWTETPLAKSIMLDEVR